MQQQNYNTQNTTPASTQGTPQPAKPVQPTAGSGGRTQQTPAAIPPPKQNPGYLNFTLRPVTKAWRTATFNSPLVGAAVLGGGLGLLGYHYAPKLSKFVNRITSPLFGGGQQEEDDQDDMPWSKADRRSFGLTLGGLGALGVLAGAFSTSSPGFGLLQYNPMSKTSSSNYITKNPLYKTANVLDSISLKDAADLIKSDPNLGLGTKLDSLALLNSFSTPPTTQITGGDIVGQAIATGKDAMVGGALGFVTAKALGLRNPSSTAILGAVANTLGIMPALGTSLIFGH